MTITADQPIFAARFQQLPGKLVIKSQATPQDIQRLVTGFGSIHVTLGKTNFFPDSGHGDVVYVEVESPELLHLNKLLGDLDHTDTHSRFVPHVTLAYVRAGTGQRFVGDSYFEGLEFDVDSLQFSDDKGNRFEVSLIDDVIKSIQKEERRDSRGHRYCIQPQVGRVPCTADSQQSEPKIPRGQGSEEKPDANSKPQSMLGSVASGTKALMAKLGRLYDRIGGAKTVAGAIAIATYAGVVLYQILEDAKDAKDLPQDLEARNKKRIDRLFGKELSKNDIVRLVGSDKGNPYVVTDNQGVAIGYNNDDYTSRVHFAKKGDKLECHYGYISATAKARGTPAVPRALAKQLETMLKLGVHEIHTEAARSEASTFLNIKQEGLIGYKVWPKMGFDGPLNRGHKSKLPKQFKKAKTLQELYAMPGGRKAWEEHGQSINCSLVLDSPQGKKAIALAKRLAASGEVTKSLDLTKDDQRQLYADLAGHNGQLFPDYERIAKSKAQKDVVKGDVVIKMAKSIQKEERRDSRGHRYCVEPSIGKVPCSKVGVNNGPRQNTSENDSRGGQSGGQESQGTSGQDESEGKERSGGGKASQKQGVGGKAKKKTGVKETGKGRRPEKFIKLLGNESLDKFVIPEDKLPKPIVDKIKNGKNVGGHEHDVYRDSDNGRYYKITRHVPIIFGLGTITDYGITKDPHSYLASINMANKLWPELDYKVHGVIAGKGKNHKPRLVTSMAEIVGTVPKSKEVSNFFLSRGWKQNDDLLGAFGYAWKDPITGTVITDTTPQNFVKTTSGGLVPIDVTVLPGKNQPEKLAVIKPGQTIEEVGTKSKSFSSVQKDLKLHEFDGQHSHIVIVNAFALRNTSPDAEEFGSFGTHVEFPFIPQGEVWIADTIDADTLPYFMANGEAQLKVFAQTGDKDKATEAGDSAEKAERDKHEPREWLNGDKDKVKVRHYKDIMDHENIVHVWLVDGRMVRDSFETEFTEGGNGLALTYIPTDEIWLDKTIDPQELKFILTHERVERCLMEHQHLPYEEAHRVASHVEFQMRQESMRTLKSYVAKRPKRYVWKGVKDGEFSLLNAPLPNSFIELDDVRQEVTWACGAMAAMACGLLWGVGPKTKRGWIDALGSNENDGTPPEAIISYLTSLGLQIEARDNMTLDDLEANWRKGWPVIVCGQDYVSVNALLANAEWEFGHWLVYIGGPAFGYIWFQDSAADNALGRPGGTIDDVTCDSGTVSAPGKVMIAVDDWMRLWHDKSGDGTKLVRYGIAIGPRIEGVQVSIKSVTKGIKDTSTERRDKRGHRYCVSPGKGRVPCSKLDNSDKGGEHGSGKHSGKPRSAIGQQGRGEGKVGIRPSQGNGRGVASQIAGPDHAAIGGKGTGKGGSPGFGTAKVGQAVARISELAEFMGIAGEEAAYNWLKGVKEHIKALGTEQALEAIGESRGNDQRVQYEGAYSNIIKANDDIDWIERYLDSAGITLVQNSQFDSSLPLISSSSEGNIRAEGGEVRDRKPGDYIPVEPGFKDKLQEAKHLPGLESSEDINKVVGTKVTQFTPDVIAKLDAQYGRKQWIVKSYGVEAFAGFGVFFPQKVRQIQKDAKATIYNVRQGLRAKGYKIAREGTKIVGIAKGGKVFQFGSDGYNSLPKSMQRLGKQLAQAAPSEFGAHLPLSPEQELREGYYGIALRKDAQGVPIGIIDWDGQDYDFGSPEFANVEQRDDGAAGYAIHRAVVSTEGRAKKEEAKFMVQPAFKAVGVKEADRAMGITWETAKEGRVHAVTRNGKASAIPYATLVGRADYLPAVFKDKNIRAMEKVVQDAINQLPASERRGQLYAPDVVKTKDGWKVIELNPSAVGGGSDWLERNPFVIDAMVSHVAGREPMHVQFVRNLLKANKVSIPGDNINRPKSMLGQVTKGLGNQVLKAGFTGQRDDKLGHKRCYKNGIPVPCSQLSDADKGTSQDQEGKPSSQVAEPGTIGLEDDKPIPVQSQGETPINLEDKPKKKKPQGAEAIKWKKKVQTSYEVGQLADVDDSSRLSMIKHLIGVSKVEPKKAKKVVEEYHDEGVKHNLDRLAEEEGANASGGHEGKRRLAKATWLALRTVAQYIPTHIMNQSVAERVAKARGATPKEAAALRETLTSIDSVGLSVIPLVATAAAPESAGLSLAAGTALEVLPTLIPVGSATYLCYSWARSPIRTGLAYTDAIRAYAHENGMLKGPWKEKDSYAQAYNDWWAGKKKKGKSQEKVKPEEKLQKVPNSQEEKPSEAAKSFKKDANGKGKPSAHLEHLAGALLDFIGSDDVRKGLFLHALDVVQGDAYAALEAAKAVVRKGFTLPPQPVDGAVAQPVQQGQQGQGQNPQQKPEAKKPQAPKQPDNTNKGIKKNTLEVTKGGTERRDKRGRKYCTQPGKGKVPCSVVNRQPQSHTPPPKTPTGKTKVKTVKYGNTKVQYSERRALKPSDLGPDASLIPMPNYRQHDDYSCSFVAVLSVVHSLDKSISPKRVLKAIRPLKAWGLGDDGVLKGLKQLGIDAQYRKDLTVANLRDCVAKKVPVLLNIYPPEWSSDHWTVVQGFTKDKVFLSNYRSMSIKEFKKEWYDHGSGIIVLGGKPKAKMLNGVVEKAQEHRDKLGHKYCTEPKVGKVPCSNLGAKNEPKENTSGTDSGGGTTSGQRSQGGSSPDDSGGKKQVGGGEASDKQKGIGQGWKPGNFLKLLDKGSNVLKMANDGGFFISPEDLNFIKTSDNVGGAEHDVYRDEKSGRYWKVTNIDFGDPEMNFMVRAYLKRIDNVGKVWPELDYYIHGITVDSDGALRIVTSMVEIVGVHPDDDEIDDYFIRNGWVPGPSQWKDPVTDTVIIDTVPFNFIKTQSGKIVPIDVDIVLGSKMPEPFKRFPRSILKEGFSGKRVNRVGATECYQNGVHVPCRPDQQGPKEGGKYSPQEMAKKIAAFGEIQAKDLKSTAQDLVKLGVAAKEAEHIAAEYFTDKVNKNVERLPPKMQKVVKGIWFGVRMTFATYVASQAVAEEVAKAKGVTPEEAKALRATLATIDMATYKPVMLASHACGISGATVIGMSLCPVGSATYLAYSLATDPVALGKGMVNAVKNAAKRMGIGKQDKAQQELTKEQLAVAILKFIGSDDTKMGLFLHSLDVVGKDGTAWDALRIAQEASNNGNH